jgi:hypothetical protein
MAEKTLPYVVAHSNITKALNKIKTASTPPRFTQDFLATKLDMKGGSAKPVIPYLKRTGFLGSDGVPTELYKRFRNQAQAGAAAAQALKIGYPALYEANEYIQNAADAEMQGIVVQITGLEAKSRVVKSVVASFRALQAFADFSSEPEESIDTATVDDTEISGGDHNASQLPGGINLGYTINLHLPPTSDVAVFNAIFKSLREHLLR